jgi:hypothetical protein|nr:MAG: protein of unknown function DUF3310 [Bacteriophage sp.]
MDRNEAHRKFADRLAPYGTYINAGEVEPIDIIERVVEGLPPDKAYSLGQVLRYCLRAGKKDDIDVELGKANNYAHRLVFGHWRSR